MSHNVIVLRFQVAVQRVDARPGIPNKREAERLVPRLLADRVDDVPDGIMLQRPVNVDFLERQSIPYAGAPGFFDVHENDVFTAFEVKTVRRVGQAELRVPHGLFGVLGSFEISVVLKLYDITKVRRENLRSSELGVACRLQFASFAHPPPVIAQYRARTMGRNSKNSVELNSMMATECLASLLYPAFLDQVFPQTFREISRVQFIR